MSLRKFTYSACVACFTVAGGRLLYRNFNINVPVYEVPADLKNRVFVVTGASKGIGKAVVEALAPTGARVIMACRDLEQCKLVRRQIAIESKNRQVVCRLCDLSSFESIQKFAAKIIKEEPRVDVLINNAGVKFVKPRRLTRESMDKQLVINFLGNHLLTMLLKEKLEAGAPARVVNVIGQAYQKGEFDLEDFNGDVKYKPAKSYFQSKLALALTTKEMAKEFDPEKVCVNGVDPGATFTQIERYTDPLINFLRTGFYWLFRRPPHQGAYPLLYAALSSDMQEVTGKFVNKKLKIQDFDEKVTGDTIVQRKAWLLANLWTNVDQAKSEVKRLVASLPNPPETKPTSATA